MNNGSKYHAEFKSMVEKSEVRVNVFADSLDEVFDDISIIHSRFAEGFPVFFESVAAAPVVAAPVAPASIKKPPPGKNGQTPICDHCGSSDYMQIINFADRKTGAPRQAWKCQQCSEWHWPNGKPNGNGNGKGS